jgi:transcriptional regulator with XRE-family HTH domain
MREDLGCSTAQLAGRLSLALSTVAEYRSGAGSTGTRRAR